MKTVHAYAVEKPGAPLESFDYELPTLGSDEVDIRVTHCGICHSDLSMAKNDWGLTKYPFVPGHEVVGVVEEIGAGVKNLQVGQTVGLGWYSGSCLSCPRCMSGDHNLCGSSEGTIIGRHGGFADLVRAQAAWVVPLPEGVSAAEMGPMFCGGMTVFHPLREFGVSPTDRVGVVGIGGLGHLAIQFAKAWGCEVTAFSTSPDKEAEARAMGAHHFVNSREAGALAKRRESFDFLLVTVNVALDWEAHVRMLRPKGRLHIVGAAPEVKTSVFELLEKQRQISSSPVGTPEGTRVMLEFAARHGIAPTTEHFPMAEANRALAHLESGKARYRIVLDA